MGVEAKARATWNQFRSLSIGVRGEEEELLIFGYRVSCSALEEEEEEWAVRIRANVKKEVYK